MKMSVTSVGVSNASFSAHHSLARPEASVVARGWALPLFALLLLTSASQAAAERFSGETMGTTWRVTLVGNRADAARLQVAIQQELDRVDSLMSNWKADSDVSRFNASGATDWFPVATDTMEVVRAALRVSKATDGAFDVTVAPLIELWDFGSTDIDRSQAPSLADIRAARARCGWAKLSVREDPPALRKADAALTINLSAIAKGYGVDRVYDRLLKADCERFMVEVGGEVRTRGRNDDNEQWRIGIEQPLPGRHPPRKVVNVLDRAMATSGDYRNVYEIDGKLYSHTIDPRTGRPVEHSLTSVSVLSESCMQADAWATALMVLGPDEGYNLAKRLEIPAYFISRQSGGLVDRTSGSFPFQQVSKASMWPVFIAAAVIFGVALIGMAIGVIISNRRLKGSCGGLANMRDSSGQTMCELCTSPSPECKGEPTDAVVPSVTASDSSAS